MRLLVLLICGLAAAQQLTFPVVKEDVLAGRLKLAHKDNTQRFQRLKQLFEEAGCGGTELREQRVSGSKQPNLICASAGTDDAAAPILVGAHFDAATPFDGVVDNWSGAALLASLREAFANTPHRHRFEFIGFAGEETGLLGSRSYVKGLSKEERRRIPAVLILDSLGMAPLKCWPNGSDPKLVQTAAAIARALKIDFSGVNVDQVGSTDSAPFKEARIPVLSMHSVTQENLAILHSPRDNLRAVVMADYASSQRLIAALLTYLDRTLD